MHNLEPILNPTSVAVIGASRDPSKRGYQAVRTLLEMKFTGRVFPVNPAGGELLGLPVARSVADLPVAPDLALVSTPAETVPSVLDTCGERGVKGAVVSAVGFREVGEHGLELERRILTVARDRNIRIVGPNTSGVINVATGLNLVGVRNVPSGTLGLLSQSGNVALDLLTDMQARRAGVSLYVGVGNEGDIAFHEYLDYMAQHDGTSAILMYVEGFHDGRAFIEAARRISLTKPIVLLKGGRSSRGVAAAQSHTGAMAGSYPVLRAALRQGGVSEVERSDELLPVAIALASQPPMPAGTDVVVISDGGGHGTLAADALGGLGVPLAQLSPETKDALRDVLGPTASVENPVDLAGAADRDLSVFTRALEIVVKDAGAGGVFLVGLFGGYSIRFSDELADQELRAAEEMIGIMRRSEKPLVVHSLYAIHDPPALERIEAAGAPVVKSLEVGSRCVRALHARGLYLRQESVPRVRPRRQRTPPVIPAARRERRVVLMETETRELLAPYRVPLVAATLCRTADEVAGAVERAETAVALKIVSPAISHKTDAGGVVLNVTDPTEGRYASKAMLEAAAAYAVDRGSMPDIRGILVTPMQPTPVAEMLVGVRRDEHFGPVLTVGAGGVMVEVHHDISLRGLPVGRDEVLEMFDEIRLARVLNGFRGRPPADRGALADLVLGVAACALQHGEIDEIEANPVFAYADRAVVVDARAILRDLTVPS